MFNEDSNTENDLLIYTLASTATLAIGAVMLWAGNKLKNFNNPQKSTAECAHKTNENAIVELILEGQNMNTDDLNQNILNNFESHKELEDMLEQKSKTLISDLYKAEQKLNPRDYNQERDNYLKDLETAKKRKIIARLKAGGAVPSL